MPVTHLSISCSKSKNVSKQQQHHTERFDDSRKHRNEMIDPTKSKNNINLRSDLEGSYQDRFESIVNSDRYKGRRKKDGTPVIAENGKNAAVKMVQVTVNIGRADENGKKLDDLSDDEITELLKNDVYPMLKDWFGGDANIIGAAIHRDESKPHLHLDIVPITEDGKLSAKKMLGNENNMRFHQKEWLEKMQERRPDLNFQRKQNSKTNGLEMEKLKELTAQAKEDAGVWLEEKEVEQMQKQMRLSRRENRLGEKEVEQTQKQMRLSRWENRLKETAEIQAQEQERLDTTLPMLDATIQEVNAMQADFQNRLASLDTYNNDLKKRETALKGRESALDERESVLDKRDGEIEEQVNTAFRKREMALNGRERAIDERERTLNKAVNRRVEERTQERIRALDERESALDSTVNKMVQERTQERESELSKRESALGSTVNKMVQERTQERESELSKRESALDSTVNKMVQERTQERESELSKRESALDSTVNKMVQERTQERESELSKRESALDSTVNKMVQERTQERESKLSKRESALEKNIVAFGKVKEYIINVVKSVPKMQNTLIEYIKHAKEERERKERERKATQIASYADSETDNVVSALKVNDFKRADQHVKNLAQTKEIADEIDASQFELPADAIDVSQFYVPDKRQQTL